MEVWEERCKVTGNLEDISLENIYELVVEGVLCRTGTSIPKEASDILGVEGTGI